MHTQLERLLWTRRGSLPALHCSCILSSTYMLCLRATAAPSCTRPRRLPPPQTPQHARNSYSERQRAWKRAVRRGAGADSEVRALSALGLVCVSLPLSRVPRHSRPRPRPPASSEPPSAMSARLHSPARRPARQGVATRVHANYDSCAASGQDRQGAYLCAHLLPCSHRQAHRARTEPQPRTPAASSCAPIATAASRHLARNIVDMERARG